MTKPVAPVGGDNSSNGKMRSTPSDNAPVGNLVSSSIVPGNLEEVPALAPIPTPFQLLVRNLVSLFPTKEVQEQINAEFHTDLNEIIGTLVLREAVLAGEVEVDESLSKPESAEISMRDIVEPLKSRAEELGLDLEMELITKIFNEDLSPRQRKVIYDLMFNIKENFSSFALILQEGKNSPFYDECIGFLKEQPDKDLAGFIRSLKPIDAVFDKKEAGRNIAEALFALRKGKNFVIDYLRIGSANMLADLRQLRGQEGYYASGLLNLEGRQFIMLEAFNLSRHTSVDDFMGFAQDLSTIEAFDRFVEILVNKYDSPDLLLKIATDSTLGTSPGMILRAAHLYKIMHGEAGSRDLKDSYPSCNSNQVIASAVVQSMFGDSSQLDPEDGIVDRLADDIKAAFSGAIRMGDELLEAQNPDLNPDEVTPEPGEFTPQRSDLDNLKQIVLSEIDLGYESLLLANVLYLPPSKAKTEFIRELFSEVPNITKNVLDISHYDVCIFNSSSLALEDLDVSPFELREAANLIGANNLLTWAASENPVLSNNARTLFVKMISPPDVSDYAAYASRNISGFMRPNNNGDGSVISLSFDGEANPRYAEALRHYDCFMQEAGRFFKDDTPIAKKLKAEAGVSGVIPDSQDDGENTA